MKSYTLTAAQESAISRLAAVGVTGRWWGRGSNAERIYLDNGRRDVKVWIEFDDPAECYGAALKVRIEECGQHANWYASQTAKIRERFIDAFQALTGQLNDETATAAVSEEQAEALVVGQEVTFYHGGDESSSNDERKCTGKVVRVERKPSDSIGDDECVEVEVEDGGSHFIFYTWRGILRCGGGAEVVRTTSLN
jgi:hypothetical protein